VRRALVTGCAGFIGSHLVESLLADGWEVLGVDCFNENYAAADKWANLSVAREYDAFTFVDEDLVSTDLAALVADCDTVFHLAAEPGVRASWGTRFDR
jgi:UDP-glucuronate 4-epimerase